MWRKDIMQAGTGRARGLARTYSGKCLLWRLDSVGAHTATKAETLSKPLHDYYAVFLDLYLEKVKESIV